MKTAPELIVFDLDGTLVDSAPDLAFSVDAMLATLNRPPAGIDAVRRWIGNGVLNAREASAQRRDVAAAGPGRAAAIVAMPKRAIPRTSAGAAPRSMECRRV